MKGHEVINHILRDEMPDVEKVRSNCHRQAASYASGNTVGLKRFVPVVAALAMLFAVSTTVFAAAGGFDWFVQRFNPCFADIVAPVMVYSENEGIRMSVIGAQSFEGMAIVYLSVTELTDANRLDMDWWPGLHLFYIEEMGSGSMSQDLLYFDVASNTAYLEIRFATNEEIPNPLTLVVDTLVFYPAEPIAGNWRLTAYTGDTAMGNIAVVTHAFMLCDVILIERMVLTPLGLAMEGTFAVPSDDDFFAPFALRQEVYAETSGGLVPLVAVGGSMSYGPIMRDGEYLPMRPLTRPGATTIIDGEITHTPWDATATTVAEFMEVTGEISVTINWETQAPINISDVTAIVIDGQRISIP
ncbi:MAG: hypothetical protein FWB88_02725 [Defluviitaleaceae bacterium]|nr:hypothetical protein [Defluviitaleaceae bacterium]MCL2238544.1 hypothetical protein [Defluviitaleaceae bacterium]